MTEVVEVDESVLRLDAECEQAFKLFDKNSDGTVSKQMLHQLFKSIGYVLTQSQTIQIESHATAVFKLEEVLAVLHQEPRPQYSNAELKKTFMNITGKAEIEVDVLKHMLKTLGDKYSDEEVARLLRVLGVADKQTITVSQLVQVLGEK